MAENRNAADRDIGEQPDHQPSGRGDRCRPTQDEQGTVEYTAQDDPADLRRTVGGQLEGEGGGHPFQYRRGEQAGGGEREQHAACDDRGQQQGAAGGAAGKKDRAEEDQQREAPVAGGERVGEHGDQTLARGVDDAAADNTAGVASKPHAHAWGKRGCELFVRFLYSEKEELDSLRQEKGSPPQAQAPACTASSVILGKRGGESAGNAVFAAENRNQEGVIYIL